MSRAVGAGTLTLFIACGCARNSDPASVLETSRELIATGKLGEAHVRLKKLLSKNSDVAAARVLLAQISLDSGDVRGADSELATLKAADLVHPEALAVRCWVDLGLGRHDRVLETLGSTQVQLPEAELARLRAVALRMQGAGADALPALRDAIAANTEDGKLVAELASTLGAIGNLSQASHELNEFLKAHPKDADALHARGELRLRNGLLVKAMDDLEAALAVAPPSWPVVKRMTAELLLGDATLASGNLAKAKERATAIEKRYPGVLGTQLLVARVALSNGQAGEAAEKLQRISDALPADSRVQSLLIEALLRSGNKARAAALLERRIQEYPNDAQARRLLAELLMQQSRPDRVVALLGEVPDSAVSAEAEEDSLLSVARLAQQRAGAAIEALDAQLAKDPANARTRVDLASAYLQSGQPMRALTTLDAKHDTSAAAVALRMSIHLALVNDREVNKIVASVLDSQHADAATLVAVADAAERAGRTDIAAPLVYRALERDPKNPDALLRRSNLDFLAGRHDGAASALDTLIALRPEDVRPRIAMARVAEAKGDIEGARAALRSGIATDPKAIEASLMLGSLELRAAQPKAAADAFDLMIETAPRDGAAANAAGALLLRLRRAEEARARFGQAVEQNETNAHYRFNLGRAQFLAGDRAAAAQSFAQAAELEPEWVDANVAAVRFAQELKQYAAAERIAQRMAKRMPKEPRSWLLLGESQLLSGRSKDAEVSFSNSYSLQPSALAALHEHRARLAAGAAKPEQPLLNWLLREPNDLGTRRRLAEFYQRSGAAKPATEQFETIVKAAPNDVAALNNLAWLLADGDTQRAEDLARRATAIVPQQPTIADTLGWVLIKAGKYAEATEVLKRAANDLPQDRSIRYHYALAAARAGDEETARRELQTALKDGAAFEGRAAAQQLSQEIGS